MQAIFIGSMGAGHAVAVSNTPFIDGCSLVLFMAGAFLIAMAVYHVRRAPERVKQEVVIPHNLR